MSPALFAAKLALGPVLLPQARWVRRTARRLPEAPGPRQGVVGEGEPGLRVLVIGDSSAAGVGIADQAQALALPLAHRLQEVLGQAVAWQLVAESGIDTAAARQLAACSPLLPADVVVTVLGVNDVTAQRTASQYVSELAALWAEVRHSTGARWLVACGLPPMGLLTAVPHPLRWYLGRYSDWLDEELQLWAAAERFGFLSLRWAADKRMLAKDGFHPGPSLYPVWAQRLAHLVLDGRKRWAHR
jgi:lysophospholipase L1-like esterase